MKVPLVLRVYLLTLISCLISTPETVRAQQSEPVSAPTMPMSGEQMSNIPYFSQAEGMASVLTLNNNTQQEMKIQVMIFNAKGQSLKAGPLTLQPVSVTDFPLADLTKNATGDFTTGNIEVMYEGKSMDVASQVGIFLSERRLSVESREADMMAFKSSKMNGIVWLPDSGSEASLALTNTAAATVKVNVSVGTQAEEFSLASRETRVLKLNDELQQQAPGAALLKLQHNGAPGAVIATGFVLNSKNGYSATFVLSDPEASRSSILAGAHVTFGIPDPTLGFSGETRFRAPLILGNVSDQAISARVSVDYTIGAQPTSLGISQVKLAPSEVKVIELTDELARLGVTGPVRDAGVDVSYDGAPGSLIGHLTSVDQTGDLSFETPIKDPLELGRMPQNSYPWNLEDNAQTVVHLKNTTSKEVWAVVQFRYPGGTYNPDRIHLNPYQTLPLNVRELQRSEQKDVRENTFPKTAARGQVVWMEETPGSMIGRAELINLPAGVSRSFSCPGACQCPAQPGPGTCSPPGYTGPIGSTPTFTAKYTTQDCQGTSFGPFNASGVSWSSGNSSIASVTPTGPAPNAIAQYVSGGTTTVTGLFTQTGYGGQGCTQQFPVPSSASCPVSSTPRIDTVSPFGGVVGNSPTVTISGVGFGTAPQIGIGCTGISAQVTSSTNSSIHATFTISSNAIPGNCQIQAFNNDQIPPKGSNTKPFLIQAPNHLTVANDVSGFVSGCTQVIVGRQITFKVVDQTPDKNSVGAVPVQESFLSQTQNSCGNGQPVPSSCQNTTQNSLFTDNITIRDCVVGGACGYNLTDEWQWCPSFTSPKNLGKLTDIVHANQVTVNGVASPSTPGGNNFQSIPANTDILP